MFVDSWLKETGKKLNYIISLMEKLDPTYAFFLVDNEELVKIPSTFKSNLIIIDFFNIQVVDKEYSSDMPEYIDFTIVLNGKEEYFKLPLSFFSFKDRTVRCMLECNILKNDFYFKSSHNLSYYIKLTSR